MPKPLAFLPFEPLLSLLRLHGFRIGIDSRMRLAEFWQLVLKQEQVPWEDLRAQIAAMLCRSAEQQSKFYELFEKYISRSLAENPGSDMPGEKPALPDDEKPPVILAPPPPAVPVPAKIEKQKSQLPSPTLPITTVAEAGWEPVYPILNFPENTLRIWNLAEMSQTLTPLQEKEWSETTEWDLPATLQATMRAGGLPSFVYRRRKRAPRYLALIEEQSPRDHLARFAAELVREFNRRDLEADFYFFEKTPARCWKSVRDLDSHVHLEWLQSEWRGARLLLMGTAESFIHPRTGEPTNLVLDLPDAWQKIALFAMNSPLEWSVGEQKLNEQFPVVPLSLQGLASLMPRWNGTAVHSPGDWQRLQPDPLPPTMSAARMRQGNEVFVELFRYLGKNGYRWLCASAVYPELFFELTCLLHDEAIPPQADWSGWKKNATWHEALHRLSSLSWMRQGWLPERIRLQLRESLPVADLELVKMEIEKLLTRSQNAVSQSSYAAREREDLFTWFSQRQNSTPEPPPEAPKLRVLWIDDHPENNIFAQKTWSKELGIAFQNALSLSEALSFLNEPFHLVISDIGRQGESQPGAGTLQALQTRGIETPVVFYTNARGMNLRGKLMELGAMEVTNESGRLRGILQEFFQKKVEVDFNPTLETAYSETPETAQSQIPDDAPGIIMSDQVMLEKLGYYNGEINGQMNDRMRQAIIAFQTGYGLVADGIIGAQTREAMKQALVEWEKTEAGNINEVVPEIWRKLARSICQITLPSGNRGTGFLTEGGYIFTSSHILPNTDAASRANAIFADPEGLAPFYFELDEQAFIANEGDISFARVKIKDWDVLKMQPFGQLSISTEVPGTSDFVSLILADESMETGPKFLLQKPISTVHDFDILFDAPETEPGAGGAPIFNGRGEVVAIYDSIVDYMDLRKGVLMKEVMWYVNASQGNRFEFWRGLIERGLMAEVLKKMQADYPDRGELKYYAEEHQKFHAERKEGKMPQEEFEQQFNRLLYNLKGEIDYLENRGNQSSYAA